MTSQSGVQGALRRALHGNVAPLLRSYGFKGTAPTWTRTSERGDVAIVNVQSSSWNTRDNFNFYVNLAVAPEPWLAWMDFRSKSPRRRLGESDGLWRRRLDPTPGVGDRDDCWTVSDEGTAQSASADVVVRLEHEGLPTIEPLLDRAVMLETLRTGTLGDMPRGSFEIYYEMALGVLLADEEPTEELHAVVDSLRQRPAAVESWPATRDALLGWIHTRRG